MGSFEERTALRLSNTEKFYANNSTVAKYVEDALMNFREHLRSITIISVEPSGVYCARIATKESSEDIEIIDFLRERADT